MTTIAWDGYTLAADKRSIYDGVNQIVTKIHRAGDCLVGGSGEFAFILAMIEWVKAGRNPADFPDHQRNEKDWQPTMVVDARGTCWLYERTPQPIRWERRFAAIGSGKHYAIAAMHLGENAANAVKLASIYDAGTGDGVDVLGLAA